MRSKPFYSAASELVPETEHPLKQLDLLEEKAKCLKNEGDLDAVIECRIKQLMLHKLCNRLYQFPLIQDLVRAQLALAEAYAEGGYFRQATDHHARAREVCSGGVHDDTQMRRLQVDLLIAEGVIYMAQERYDLAEPTLSEAARVVREVLGEHSPAAAKVHQLMGLVAQLEQKYGDAIEHYRAAREAQESFVGETAEIVLQLKLSIAESLYADRQHDEALKVQKDVVADLRDTEQSPVMHVDALSQLARWLENLGREHDEEALEALQDAEVIVDSSTSIGKESPKAVEVKRDVALLHLKMGHHDIALQYLVTVEYLERRLHGSQSTNVARTLKALGTVHMVRNHVVEAEDCLRQALRIFEADYQSNSGIIRDIHVKLKSIANLATQQA